MPLPEDASETTVATKVTFAAAPARAWDTLMFYEEVAEKPPLHLRLLLPVPIRTEGSKEAVGDEALCLYQSGSLIKRVTDVEPQRRYGFAVVKQDLDVGGGMRLSGGSYTLTALPGGRTEVEAVTRYTSPRRPRWLWTRVEAVVCHMFHRHILREMRRHAETPRALKGAAPT
ncbi:MAG: hypothetical protein IT380_16105 [Myxococcales bacterium]|nr:hypothetical protein [Myxococcales bacterium]